MAYAFSKATEDQFQWLLTRYPKKDAVLIPLLHVVQDEVGWLSPEAIEYVAGRMGVSPARVREVASFYTMFKLDKKGRYVLQLCHNISCYLRGCDDLVKKAEGMLGIKVGETTPDGKFSLETVECLASCGTAPVLQVNTWDFHEELDEKKLKDIIENLKSDRYANPSYDARVKEGSAS